MEKSTTRTSLRSEGSRSVAWRFRAAAVCAAAIALACAQGKGVQDPANELPFGHVDTPAPGAEVHALTAVGGWAMDDRGIREIRLYVDGRIVNTCRLTTPRPDVSRAYPTYAHGGDRHGWTMVGGFDAPGFHAVLVQAVDNDGATRDIGSFNVTSLDK
jgi:hypothetical protein